MRKFYFYITILLLTGCSHSSTVKKLESNRTVSDIFDKSEIKDLAVIVDFFNGQICSSQKNVSQCYQRFFEWMKACEVKGDIDVNIPYGEQQTMYSQLSENTFNQVWRIDQCRYRAIQNEADTVEIINIAYAGKYLKFLKAFGKENSFVELYSDRFEQMGLISPSCFGMVIVEYKQFDVNDIRIQLFLAMHYLTLNDENAERKKLKPNTSYENYRSGTLPKSSKELK